ncbi:MAG: hypothetical protein ACREXR_16020 [Gammaproteobacteria bacterium]
MSGGGEPVVLNCGYGHGYSVREVIRAIEKIRGQRLNVREEPSKRSVRCAHQTKAITT